MKILITGATGFLGRYVVAAALRRGHQVRALARPSRRVEAPIWGQHPNLELAFADLRRPGGLTEALAGIDAVIHLAAAKSGDIYAQLGASVVGTENLLAAMDTARVGRIIACSSFAVYDYRRPFPLQTIDEDSKLEKKPEKRDAYVQTKLMQETLIRDHAQEHGWSWIVLRPGVVYGKDNLWTARLGSPGRRIWFRIGVASRLPMTYVENCADAFVSAAESESASGEILNVVDDDPPTQPTYARAIRHRMNPRPKVVVVPWIVMRGVAGLAWMINGVLFRGRAKLPGILVGPRIDARFKPLRYSNTKIKSLLGWSPRFTMNEALDRSSLDEKTLLRVGDGPAHRPPVALLLAGGLGTRLKPLTDVTPKCLVPICGRPILDFWLESLQKAEVQQARVNTHALAERVREYIVEVNGRGGIQLEESYEPQLLGSAGTVTANADLADLADEIILVYADNLSNVDLDEMLRFHRSHGDPFTMLLFRAPNPKACGIAELDGEGRVVSFEEKPAEPKGDLANAGIYIVSSSAYREIAEQKAFDLGFEVLPKFVGRMRGWAWTGYHRDIGTPQALEMARSDFAAVPLLPRSSSTALRPAVFLDRDGTLIEQVHYLADPAGVRLLPGVAEALRDLRDAGFALVVVSNQSVIARGFASHDEVFTVHQELRRQLAEESVSLDGIYYCPHAPRGEDRTIPEHPDRKPSPGMLLRAAADLGLDLQKSYMIGDMISDVIAGENAGCAGSFLVQTGKGMTPSEVKSHPRVTVFEDLVSAAASIIGTIEPGIEECDESKAGVH